MEICSLIDLLEELFGLMISLSLIHGFRMIVHGCFDGVLLLVYMDLLVAYLMMWHVVLAW
jgi:hypothetical protein